METAANIFRSYWWLFLAPVAVLALMLLGGWLFSWILAGDGQQKKNTPPQTGVELIFGIPGSGKSFVMMIRIVEVMRRLRRPVYTNLPIRWRVFRWWLRREGGERLAGLIHELTEKHLVSFMDRFEAYRIFREDVHRRKPHWQRKQVRRVWLRVAGPDVTEGPKANWIPPGAVVCIDEAHHLFPNSALKNVDKREPPSLMSYLTMHRHAQHWVWITTQSETQISTTIRKLASMICSVSKRDEDKVIWGIRFKHLRIKALRYKWFLPENWSGGAPLKPEVCFRQFMYFPTAWWNQIWFRLYSSHTHLGSSSELKDGLRQARIDAGLDASGSLAVKASGDKAMPRLRVVPRLVGFVFKTCIWGGLLIAGFVVAFWLGGQRANSPPGAEVSAVAPAIAGQAVTNVAASQPAASMPVDPSGGGVVAAMSPGGVRFTDGRLVKTGGTYAQLELVSFDVREGLSIWNDRERGDVWLWGIKQQARRVGTFSAVAATLDEARKRRAYIKGNGVDGVRPR